MKTKATLLIQERFRLVQRPVGRSRRGGVVMKIRSIKTAARRRMLAVDFRLGQLLVKARQLLLRLHHQPHLRLGLAARMMKHRLHQHPRFHLEVRVLKRNLTV
jgi:hypothetical protein